MLTSRCRLLAAATAVCLLLLAVAVRTAAAAAAPRAWVLPSLARTTPEAPAKPQTSVSLYAARGEAESFQIVVTAPEAGLTKVNVIAPDLVGADGGQIASRNIVLYREHFVYLPDGSFDWEGRNRPLGPGWYPDALIPFVDPQTGLDLVGAAFDAAPFDVASGKSEVVWVDIQVPRETFPGDYWGEFLITSDQGEARVSLELTVWGFELPLQPRLKSSFGTSSAYPERGEELLRHRLMPRSVPVQEERRLIDSYGLNCTNAGFYSGASGDNCVMEPAPSVTELREAESRHDPEVWLYAYTADEVGWCTNLYDDIKLWARNLHQTRIHNLITMAPVRQLYDDGTDTGRSAVDVWVMLPKLYDAAADAVAYVLTKGDEAWSYNCLVQDDYSPKWEIDFAPINYRIQPGFINQSLGLTGLLYWRADSWSDDPWDDPRGYGGCPGEGLLLYPGYPVGLPGATPSMRLKWLRDGVDDYDYIEMLEEAGDGEWARSVARSVGPDWTNWERDPVMLEVARRELGYRLESSIGDIDFIDVPADYWAFDEIRTCYRHGIVQGFGNHTYRPTKPVTRDQMAVYIARAVAGGDQYVPTGPAEPTFVDVLADHWAYKYIEYVYEQKIVTGYPHRHYLPGKEVDRAHMATFIARAIVTPTGDAGLADYVPPGAPTFTDVPPRHWAYKYIEYLAEQDIVRGYDNGTYRPLKICTRDQLAVYMARAFDLMETPVADPASRTRSR